ncbi:SDR family oxidoreductase [Tumebacillus permanentifrigoris]|uniref:NAD(P)-dependent dehydrogenase (Short-subunit alcohol dehydrogenase family) n=1 Tax=Tumebacillus permanentifrigoris TaxID=378543 RepID=A0A316DRI4_9BACL|nr:SDR family oxidoreductase [Tumebacillus permanentifrigoris]PWK07429.1 NAD(P)-dependent dehydrogenase (short-subunit alcohol dehydrogenase family) [Tumebacillus permanentifrigoris]
MKGKVCLVTGGNSGIGKATALELAKKGATVVLLCRSRERGELAVRAIQTDSGNPQVELLVADLASQKSVRQAAEEFQQRFEHLHVLVNNAGVFLPNREETEEGIEKTFAVNYLSHFLLTHLLLKRLKASAPSRIINVASKTAFTNIDLDDLNLTKRKYSVMRAVAPTKLALVIFTKELAMRLRGTQVTVNALHPGVVKTNLLHDMPRWMQVAFTFQAVGQAQGAKTPVYLASSTDVEAVSGEFFVNCKPAKTNRISNDPVIARRLWEVSTKLTGLQD